MSKTIFRIPAFWIIYTAIFVIMKPLFMAVYSSVIGDTSISAILNVIYHGLPMDCSMAAYLTIIPAILTIIELWHQSRFLSIANKVYIGFTSLLISFVTIIDLVLYSYWNFRLDTTPFFYFFSSPSAAMASTGILNIIIGIIACCIITIILYLLITHTAGAIHGKPTRNIISSLVAFLLTVALIIPIRGSLTVSTMNLSRSYFSSNQRLNHAAINPLFSLMYSATHQNNFSSQFRFFDEDKADEIFSNLSCSTNNTNDSIGQNLLLTDRPDIYIIILESFSANLMPSLGGEAIATGLDSIATDAHSFTNFYASGARTDRALPAILSGFPAQPTTSLMKYAKKIEHAPSLPRELKEQAGYDMSYYYGGDANFTNMLAYLVSSGFDKIISDKDFPVKLKTGKWGAHDHVVFDRVWSDINDLSQLNNNPKLRVIQTSSSHEPFEVPYSDSRFTDSKRKNAFAYADFAVTNFIDSLSSSDLWGNALVIITADHYGVYPEHVDNPLLRHHIPLIITGGAVNPDFPQQIETIGDQTSLATTLLSALGLDSSDFKFSRNLFDDKIEHYAFFSEPGMAAYINAQDTAVINLDNNASIIMSSDSAAVALDKCKAIIQTVYNTIDNL